MCGIAGAIALDPRARPDAERVAAMSQVISHRGPDGEGLWISPSGKAILAHRRLSVIDLETGAQPIVGPDGSTAIVFNGEIYNYIELRDSLKSQGEQFRTKSDTEVLLALLERRGLGALDSLVGMFAFAYWDDERQEFLAARDRLGKKPFFYAEEDGCLLFSSTLGSLRRGLRRVPKISPLTVSRFLDLGYPPAPDTIYEGVHKLPAATSLRVTSKAAPELSSFWHPLRGDRPAPPATYEGALDRLEQLLTDAVRIRLRSDVPLGVFLSGGVDSSLVAAIAQRATGQVATFTIGFDVPELDESPRAQRMADHLGTSHHAFTVSADVVELLPAVLRHFGEPFAHSSALPLWHLACHARPHITVALGGDGGDEGFAGYDWYRTYQRMSRLDGWLGPAAFRRVFRRVSHLGGRRANRVAHLLTDEPAERYADLMTMFGDRTVESVFSPSFRSDVPRPLRAATGLASIFRECDRGPIHACRFVDMRTYLADGVMPKVDISTMAHGLEARAPLLDHRVLEFAFSLPDAFLDPRQPKKLLRDLLARYAPRELIEGPKRGFTVPFSHWFRSSLREEIGGLPTSTLADTGWFDVEGLRGLVDEHLSGRRDNAERLFRLFVLRIWLDGNR